MYRSRIAVFVLVLFVTNAQASKESGAATYEELFNQGVEAYLQSRWYECMSFMLRAVEDYKTYRSVLVDCRLSCEDESNTKINPSDFLDYAFFEKAFKRSDCVEKCKEQRFGQRSERVTAKVENEFKKLTPYDYIQICSYKVEKYERAASAAYTFLLANPDHELMQSNVQFYRSMPEVKPSYFKNLEAKPHQEYYVDGIQAYGRQEWLTAIKYIEEALQQYYAEERRCCALCEGSYDQRDFPDLYTGIADHYASVLQCKQKCVEELATVYGKMQVGFLHEHYNYLQYAYFKTNDLVKAAECVGTYLLFNPSDATMLSNQRFYQKTGQVNDDHFKPRHDAKKYHERKSLESQLMTYVDRHTHRRARAIAAVSPISEEEELRQARAANLEQTTDQDTYKSVIPIFGPKDETYKKEMEQYEHSLGVKVTQTSEDLNGEHRLVADGFFDQSECQTLMTLAKAQASQGDGYRGTERQTSPHTDREIFEGLTVLKAAELAKSGDVPVEQASLYLSSSETARKYVEKYYNLRTPLYFQYTHLVCRTSLSGSEARYDLSHPVHSDNCVIQEDGSCVKTKPAYVWRDFTAMVYLNDDFEGGNFFFAHRNKSVQTEIRPKCGRLVSFHASEYHGVQAVTGGRRCAVALWFTLDKKFQEWNFLDARDIMKTLKAKDRKMNEPALKTFLEENKIQVTLMEDQLNGTDRFQADSLATQEECDLLRQLANDAGLEGDGYMAGTGRIASPHTDHESFEGLTVIRAAELVSTKQVNPKAANLYLKLSELGRHLTEVYFGLKTPLYFDYTHLVCRTALPDQSKERKDLSHPIHADNCNIMPDGSCPREPPAYVQRDFSAIMYLNEDFTGGDFFFANKDLSEQASVKPKCGRIVAFNASIYHGVKPVLSGQRCAVAMWYTLDEKYNEVSHKIAMDILKNAETEDDELHTEL